MSTAEITRPSISSRLAGSGGILLAHFIALSFVLITLTKTAPIYAVVFEHQNFVLPAATQKVLWLSEFCVAYFLPIAIFMLLADAVVVLTLALAAPRKRWLLSVYSHGCLLVAGAAVLYVTAWLAHPQTQLLNKVAGGAELVAADREN